MHRCADRQSVAHALGRSVRGAHEHAHAPYHKSAVVLSHSFAVALAGKPNNEMAHARPGDEQTLALAHSRANAVANTANDFQAVDATDKVACLSNQHARLWLNARTRVWKFAYRLPNELSNFRAYFLLGHADGYAVSSYMLVASTGANWQQRAAQLQNVVTDARGVLDGRQGRGLLANGTTRDSGKYVD